MHLVLVVATFVAALRALFVRIPAISTRVAPLRLAAALGVPLAWVYADLAGGSGSAMRAAWMTSAALLAHVLSRRPDTQRAFGLSVAGMALADPLVAFDLSFALSAAATAGLLGLSSRLARPALARAPDWLAPVIRAVSASLAASIACAPVLACMTADLPLAGILANLVAVPLGEMAALPLCLAHALLEPMPGAERGCALAASGALAMVRVVAHGFARVPWGTVPVPTPTAGQLAAIAVGALATARAVTRRPWRWALPAPRRSSSSRSRHVRAARPPACSASRCSTSARATPPSSTCPTARRWSWTAAGSSAAPSTRASVSSRPCCAREGEARFARPFSRIHIPITSVAFVAGSTASRWGRSGTPDKASSRARGDYAALLAELRGRGVPILRPSEVCGERVMGGARVEVLAPCPELTADRGANDNSFVIRVSLGARSVLLVGDAEHAVEGDLVARMRESLASRRAQGRPSRQPDVDDPCIPRRGRPRGRDHLVRGPQSLRSPRAEHALHAGRVTSTDVSDGSRR